MSWFTKLTGINEESPAQVREQLSVDVAAATAQSPNKSECLGWLILFGERAFRNVAREYVAHYPHGSQSPRPGERIDRSP
jgi:hypothetical protein